MSKHPAESMGEKPGGNIHMGRRMMQVTVNGENRTYDARMTLSTLLGILGINPCSVAVERNLRIVPRTELESEWLEEGDRIEVIRFVGGG